MDSTPLTEQSTGRLSELSELTSQFEHLIATGNYDAAREMFSTNMLALWFGMPLDRLTRSLAIITERSPDRVDLVAAIHMFLNSANSGKFFDPQVVSSFTTAGPHHPQYFRTLYMYHLRASGKPKQALETVMREAPIQLASIQPFFDRRNAWSLFHSLQLGLTALLAGDNQQALMSLEDAKLRPEVSALRFLSRDVWAKSAVLHAAWGDPVEARSCIERASKYERTVSWAEDHIDVHLEIAEVLLETDPTEAFNKLKRIDLQNLGELWPFYVHAVFRTYRFSGAQSQVDHQLSLLQSLPFPKNDGEGFSGSVFPSSLALHHLFSGRAQLAKETITEADREITTTKIVEALIEVYTGNPKRAVNITSCLRGETQGLRQLELTRLSIEVTAHDALGDLQAVNASLAQALAIPRSLHPREALLFSRRIRAYANTHIPGWPSTDDVDGIFDGIPSPRVQLSDREVDVLRHLAQDLTRAEIAEKLYISVNTVKTQLASAYRKLGATGREEAILAARRLGLF